MADRLPLSMGLDTLEAAHAAVKAAELHLSSLMNEDHDSDLINYTVVVKIDGQIIGRVGIEDGSYAAFIPNGDWCGFTVEAMG
jgi:hypothetical protein